MINKFINFIYTVSYLKFTQIYYQLFYRIRIFSFKQNLKRPNLDLTNLNYLLRVTRVLNS